MMNMTFTRTATLLTTLTAAVMLSACGQSRLPVGAAQMPTQMQRMSTPQFQADQQVMVRFRPGASRTAIQQFGARFQLQTVNFLPELNVYVMRFRQPLASQSAFQTAVSRMSQDPAIALVEINQRIEVAPVVNDMYISPILN